jgi:hypothetical protein
MRYAGESRRSRCPPDPVFGVRQEKSRKQQTSFKRNFIPSPARFLTGLRALQMEEIVDVADPLAPDSLK